MIEWRHVFVGWFLRIILAIAPRDESGLDLVKAIGEWNLRDIRRTPPSQDRRSGGHQPRWSKAQWAALTDEQRVKALRGEPLTAPPQGTGVGTPDSSLRDIWFSTDGVTYMMIGRAPIGQCHKLAAEFIEPAGPASAAYLKLARHGQSLADVTPTVIGRRGLYSADCDHPLSDAPCGYAGTNDKTVETCRAKFDNRANFAGVPFPAVSVEV